MAQVRLSDKDVDALIRVVATEADHRLAWTHPQEYSAQVHGIVDTVLNRVASGQWGSTVASVANAKNQFSAINGPRNRGYTVYGTVDKVPSSKIPTFLPNIITSWVTQRSSGTPSSVGGGLNYANPKFSDKANLGWINKLDGPRLGYGNSTHYHGTVAGLKPTEAQVIYGGFGRLQDIHDRQAAAQGHGALPPLPATMSASLAASRGGPAAPAVKVASAQPQPRFATMPNGKQVEVGKLYPMGDKVFRGGVGSDGKGTLERVSAGMFDEAMKPTIGGQLIRSAIGNVVRSETPKIAAAIPAAFSGVPSLVSSAGDRATSFFGDLFGGSAPKPPAVAPPKSANANLNQQRAEQAAIRAPVAAPPPPQTKTITKTVMVPNPEWGKVNPVAVNKLQDIHDRREAGVMAAQGIPQNIPQFIPKTVTQVVPATMSPQLAAVRKSVPLPPALPTLQPPVPRPYAEGMLARANGMKPPVPFGQAIGNWFAGTPMGQGIDLLNGKLPQQSTGGLIGALMGMRNTQPIHLAIAQQALRDPAGFAIGEANRRSPNPSYDVSGGNNAFNPASVQNSSRWQTGY